MHTHRTHTAIIGAGLSGLAIAEELSTGANPVAIFEARDRVGGRILSLPGPASPRHRYDLGPAWIWPHNRRMRALADRLGLQTMPQYATGNLVFQDEQGQVRRDLAFSTMQGALRIRGGMARLPEALSARLPEGTLHLAHRVTHIAQQGGALLVTGSGPDGPFSAIADRVILALPPRVIADRIAFEPDLSGPVRAALDAVPTWMAAQGKVVAIYDRPFWRDAGLSGDAISHRGPLFEIHDASPACDGTEAALFGFIHPAAIPSGPEEPGFRSRVSSQLAQLFGPDAAMPLDVQVKRWGLDRETATPLDRPDPGGHPAFRPITITDEAWAGQLLVSGTETAATDGGFLEGALEAAHATVDQLQAINA